MIILEGPDGSGKSTLGFKISEEIGLPIIHSGGPPKSEEELTLRVIYSQDNSLLDRHPYLSEIIYGTLNGRTPMITFDKTWLWLSNNKPLIIYCSPGLDYLLKNLDKLKTKAHKSAEHLQ
jgi:adenylate kinase family enzyme